MIVAWHEVPWAAPPQRSRPGGYSVIRAGCARRFDDWSDEIRREIPLGFGGARSYRTLWDGSFEGRLPRLFVPSYDHTVPPGRSQTFRNSKLAALQGLF
jgi:hypothetical protein